MKKVVPDNGYTDKSNGLSHIPTRVERGSKTGRDIKEAGRKRKTMKRERESRPHTSCTGGSRDRREEYRETQQQKEEER